MLEGNDTFEVYPEGDNKEEYSLSGDEKRRVVAVLMCLVDSFGFSFTTAGFEGADDFLEDSNETAGIHINYVTGEKYADEFMSIWFETRDRLSLCLVSYPFPENEDRLGVIDASFDQMKAINRLAKRLSDEAGIQFEEVGTDEDGDGRIYWESCDLNYDLENLVPRFRRVLDIVLEENVHIAPEVLVEADMEKE